MAAVGFDHAEIGVGGTTVLEDVTLQIADGEFLGVIGPSGSGKTTLLRAVAGFADILRGSVRFDGVDMAGVKVSRRDVGMVFQDPVLFAHRSVERNVSFPLELRHQPQSEIQHRVGAEVRALHVEHLLRRNPAELSRGEAQLVQIARTMVRTPRVLLLDEPLANLDEATKRRLRRELSTLQRGYGVTTIMTTNDPDDAMQMPSRLAVLDAGRLVQVGTPAEVRRSPATLDAALSTGELWTMSVRVQADVEGFWLVRDGAHGQSFRHRAWAPALRERVGGEVIVGVRPSEVSVVPAGPVHATVTRLLPGQPTTIICDVADRPVGAHCDSDVSVGDTVGLRFDHVAVFDAVTRRAIG